MAFSLFFVNDNAKLNDKVGEMITFGVKILKNFFSDY
jgi:hypothetical protein